MLAPSGEYFYNKYIPNGLYNRDASIWQMYSQRGDLAKFVGPCCWISARCLPIVCIPFFFFYCRFIVITACYADIAFVIDNSGSIRDNELPGGNNWQLILDFVKSIVNMFTISPDVTRIAVVDFGWCCCQLFVCFSFSLSVFPFSLLPLYV